jgi:hypothetical protein
MKRFLLMLFLLSVVMIGDVALLALVANSIKYTDAWASFVPDLLVGVITTGGLGLLLWQLTRRLEQSADRISAKRQASSSWRTLARRLATVVNTEDFELDPEDASSLGPVADRVIQLLEEEPLDEYFALLEHDEIKRASAALVALETARGLGRGVNAATIDVHRRTMDASYVSSRLAQAVWISGAYGVSGREAAVHYGVSLDEMDAVLKYIASNTTPALEVRLGEYAMARMMAERKLQKLRSDATSSTF